MSRRRATSPLRATVVAAVLAVTASAGLYFRRCARRPRWRPPAGLVVETSSLSVRVLGDVGPPILLLHGLVSSGIYWGGAYDGLADRHRLVVPDLLGFGQSPHPPSGYGPDDHIAALNACLDDLGITEPVVIGAHSLGSLIALRLAATHPERVAAIVAFGSPIYADARAALAHVAGTGAMGRLFVLPGRTSEIACQWVCGHRVLAARVAVVTHPDLPPEIAAAAVQHTWSSYSQTLEHVILAAEVASWLDKIACPVTLVAGDDDPVIDHRYLRVLADANPNITLLERPGKHDLPLTDPTDCAALIEAAHRFADRPDRCH